MFVGKVAARCRRCSWLVDVVGWWAVGGASCWPGGRACLLLASATAGLLRCLRLRDLQLSGL